MLNEELELCNNDEHLLSAIYKALEIYDIIKNTQLRIDNKIINKLDKKYLSLLLGICSQKNEVSKILNLLRYDYGIQVYTHIKTEKEYVKIYKSNFKDILDNLLSEDTTIKDFMLKLIEVDFIKYLHNNNGMSLMRLKLLLNNSMENKEKSKTLQKK